MLRVHRLSSVGPAFFLVLALPVLAGLGCGGDDDASPQRADVAPPPIFTFEDVYSPPPDGVVRNVECLDNLSCRPDEECVDNFCIHPRPCSGLCNRDEHCNAGLVCHRPGDEPGLCVVDPALTVPQVAGTYTVSVGEAAGCEEEGALIPLLEGQTTLTINQPCEGDVLEAQVSLVTVNPMITSYGGTIAPDGTFHLDLLTPVTIPMDQMPGCGAYYDLSVEGSLVGGQLDARVTASIAIVMLEQSCEWVFKLFCEAEAVVAGSRTGDLAPVCAVDGDCPSTHGCQGGTCVEKAACYLPCRDDQDCLMGLSCQSVSESPPASECLALDSSVPTVTAVGSYDLDAVVIENECDPSVAPVGQMTRTTLVLEAPCEAQTLVGTMGLVSSAPQSTLIGLLEGDGSFHLDLTEPFLVPHPTLPDCLIGYAMYMEATVADRVVQGSITHTGTYYQVGGGPCAAESSPSCLRVDSFESIR